MAAATHPFVSIEEYLDNIYRPDLDLVDGALEERNGGEFDHQAVQRALLLALSRLEQEHGFYTALELRVQVSPDNFRVPDLCLLPADRLPERYVVEAPLLCIEVLSPEDRFTHMQRRCDDYLRMGVPTVWIIDPAHRLAYVLEQDGVMRRFEQGNLPAHAIGISLPLAELFNSLQR